MALVSYSDSEASDDDQPQAPQKAPTPPPVATKPTFNPIVDKSNPRKIRVNLAETPEQRNGDQDGEPAAKRPRVGGGAFSGFNAMLPAPKRAAQTNGSSTASKGAPRKVFSLKTGAEPGFDRSADAELKELFAEQETERQSSTRTEKSDSEEATSASPAPATLAPPPKPIQGNAMMFKPLSVARGPPKKRKPQSTPSSAGSTASPPQAERSTAPSPSPAISKDADAPPPSAPKVSLFSMRSEVEEPTTNTSSTEYTPLVYSGPEATTQANEANINPSEAPLTTSTSTSSPQSLQSIASDLHLTASQRRQLFGRHHSSSSSSAHPKILHFNTDAEYASNEALRASGEAEANQHRTVKAIAPGKHNLKQLINNASGQAEALEDSFAAGRRNKKEAGNRYGW